MVSVMATMILASISCLIKHFHGLLDEVEATRRYWRQCVLSFARYFRKTPSIHIPCFAAIVVLLVLVIVYDVTCEHVETTAGLRLEQEVDLGHGSAASKTPSPSTPIFSSQSSSTSISSDTSLGPRTPPDSPLRAFFSFHRRVSSPDVETGGREIDFPSMLGNMAERLKKIKLLGVLPELPGWHQPYLLPQAPYYVQRKLDGSVEKDVLDAYGKNVIFRFHYMDQRGESFLMMTKVEVPFANVLSLSSDPLFLIRETRQEYRGFYNAGYLSLALFMDVLYNRPIEWIDLLTSLPPVPEKTSPLSFRPMRDAHPLLDLIGMLEYIRAGDLVHALKGLTEHQSTFNACVQLNYASCAWLNATDHPTRTEAVERAEEILGGLSVWNHPVEVCETITLSTTWRRVLQFVLEEVTQGEVRGGMWGLAKTRVPNCPVVWTEVADRWGEIMRDERIAPHAEDVVRHRAKSRV